MIYKHDYPMICKHDYPICKHHYPMICKHDNLMICKHNYPACKHDYSMICKHDYSMICVHGCSNAMESGLSFNSRYYRLFQLQTGHMVWYTLSGFNIPRARGYYLSWAEIIFLSYFKSYLKCHFEMASQGKFLAFLFLVEFENFLHH